MHNLSLFHSVLILFVIFLATVITKEIGDARRRKKNMQVETLPKKLQLRLSVFASKTLWDLYVLYILFMILGISKKMPETMNTEDAIEFTFIFVVLFLTVDVFIRFTINYLRSENGKPDILDLYLKEDQNGD